jgi:hypothetical protein
MATEKTGKKSEKNCAGKGEVGGRASGVWGVESRKWRGNRERGTGNRAPTYAPGRALTVSGCAAWRPGEVSARRKGGTPKRNFVSSGVPAAPGRTGVVTGRLAAERAGSGEWKVENGKWIAQGVRGGCRWAAWGWLRGGWRQSERGLGSGNREQGTGAQATVEAIGRGAASGGKTASGLRGGAGGESPAPQGVAEAIGGGTAPGGLACCGLRGGAGEEAPRRKAGMEAIGGGAASGVKRPAACGEGRGKKAPRRKAWWRPSVAAGRPGVWRPAA